MLPPHPPMAEGPGGPMYNGLHAGDPAWSPIIKVVPNNADNSDQQQVKAPFYALLTKLVFYYCSESLGLFNYVYDHRHDILLLSLSLSLYAGVARYLGTSRGQRAPEPRQLRWGVDSNQMHKSMIHSAKHEILN